MPSPRFQAFKDLVRSQMAGTAASYSTARNAAVAIAGKFIDRHRRQLRESTIALIF